jgi:GR25 family glycosyltransferase involved in LPS biosynthesis
MNLNYFFDKIYCINLDKRIDRWQDITKQFEFNWINEYTRIPGIEGNIYNLKSDKYPHPMRGFNGVSGGTMAHLNVYLQAYGDKCKCFLVIEDDCVFHNNLQNLWTKCMEQLPVDWDLLYLGGMFEPSKGSLHQVTTDLLKGSGIMSTHCYAVRDTILLRLISTFLKDYPYLTDSADGFLCQIQKECNTYAFYPPLAWQKAGFSDIQNEYRDYEERFKKLI